MKNIAIVFTSRYGQTRMIAEHIKLRLKEQGHSASIHEVTGRTFGRELSADVDAVIIGSPVYVHRFPNSILLWARNQQGFLRGKTTAFFSVAMNAADKRPEARKGDDDLIREFISLSGLSPDYVASIAGALNFTRYGWFTRWVMKRISRANGGPTDTSRDYEFTDWAQVDLFTDTVVGKEQEPRFVTHERLAGAA
jgi:menaquinone-dependent protoporphyrinogen oxidase